MRLLALLCWICAAGSAQTIALSNGVHLQIRTTFGKPDGQQVIQAALEPASGNSFYRIFRDQNGLAVYCYELAVDRTSAEEFRLTVRPAGNEFAAKFPRADGGKPTPTVPADRELGLLHSGEQATFQAFELAGSGEKVVDTITLALDPGAVSAGGGHPLRFAGLRVTINGAPIPGPAGGDVSGRFALFFVPGRGGYFFTTGPVDGRPFVQAGWVEGKHMQFTLENENFEATAQSPFVRTPERSSVWVYHDPNFKPKGAWTQMLETPAEPERAPEFFTAAADSLGWWVQQPTSVR
jgi:hypothetical protein